MMIDREFAFTYSSVLSAGMPYTPAPPPGADWEIQQTTVSSDGRLVTTWSRPKRRQLNEVVPVT